MDLAAFHLPALDYLKGDATQAYEVAMRLGGLLAEDAIGGLSLAGLLSGSIESTQETGPVVLFSAEQTRIDWAASWADSFGELGLSTILFGVGSELGTEKYLSASDIRALVGYGVVMGSAGWSGRPLVGLPLATLRDELVRSRESLSRAANYAIYTLCPRPNALGIALDRLVLREAKRAGYKFVFAPGSKVVSLDELAEDSVIRHRWISSDDRPAELRDWVLDKRFARRVAQMKHYREWSKNVWEQVKSARDEQDDEV